LGVPTGTIDGHIRRRYGVRSTDRGPDVEVGVRRGLLVSPRLRATSGRGFAVARSFRGVIHSVIHDLQATRPGVHPITDLNVLLGVQMGLSVGEVVLVVVGVVFLIWQYNAARVARGLGYPARTSPGFGVASWFIPIVNIWFPYWALSDCLPPGHRLRPTALWAWLAYIGATRLVAAAAVTALFSELGAVIPLFLALATMATAVTLGCRLISAVHQAHELVLQPNSP
jgi:hypothetical protein